MMKYEPMTPSPEHITAALRGIDWELIGTFDFDDVDGAISWQEKALFKAAWPVVRAWLKSLADCDGANPTDWRAQCAEQTHLREQAEAEVAKLRRFVEAAAPLMTYCGKRRDERRPQGFGYADAANGLTNEHVDAAIETYEAVTGGQA